METSKEFFTDLLDETKKSFENSPIKKYREQFFPSQKWNYSICETPIKKGKGIIVGLNWGGNDYEPQSVYPINNSSFAVKE
jgi:hypothetical protein